LYLRADDVDADVGRWLVHLSAQGLIHITDDVVSPPPAASGESYRLTLLAQIDMEMLERYFIAIGILQRSGQRVIDRTTLETDCVALARRLSRLYRLNAPEFFEARWFRNFVDTLIDRGVVHVDPDGRLGYDALIDEVTRASSLVLNPEFRMAVLRARSPQRNANQPASTAAPR
jgi:glycerol-3-phosphate O-acyltransferase